MQLLFLCGPSGSGKTYYANQLPYSVIHTDAYYLDKSDSSTWESFHESCDIVGLLHDISTCLSGGQPGKRAYQMRGERTEQVINYEHRSNSTSPKSILLVEGIFALDLIHFFRHRPYQVFLLMPHNNAFVCPLGCSFVPFPCNPDDDHKETAKQMASRLIRECIPFSLYLSCLPPITYHDVPTA